MAGKTGQQYADDVRELRAQGVDFPSATDGYILADAANWSSGQKAAVTRAINLFDFSEFDAAEAAREARRDVEPSDLRDAEFAPDAGMGEAAAMEFFADAAGDELEEYEDIDYFLLDESDELDDEEGDDYEETT